MRLFGNSLWGAGRPQGVRKVKVSDTPVNPDDQVTDIERRLWRVRRESALERILELATPLSVAMIGMGVGFAVRRKYGLLLLPLLGLVVQQSLGKQRSSSLARHLGIRDRRDIELERYALKLQRGDYGKMEVIPFR